MKTTTHNLFSQFHSFPGGKAQMPARGKSIVGLSLLLALLGAGLNATAASITWSAAGNAFWEVPGSWVGGVVPTNTDDVTLITAATMQITNPAAANSITLANTSGAQYLEIYRLGSWQSSTLVVNGAIQRSPENQSAPNATVSIWGGVDYGTDGVVIATSIEDYTTTLPNSYWANYLTTDFNIYSYVQMQIGGSSPVNSVFYHQAGGTVSSPNSGNGLAYGITLGEVTSYGTGISNTIAYYLDSGALQADRIGAGNADGNNYQNLFQRWMPGSVMLYFNNGTIQPYNNALYVQNMYACKNYTTNPAVQPDMQIANWSPTTIVLATNGNAIFDTTLGVGGYANIYLGPSAQLVDSTNGPGSLIKNGAYQDLLFCSGDNPYATNRYSGATTVNGGEVQSRFDLFAGQAASPTGTNVLVDAFSPNSELILNGGNFSVYGRANCTATNYSGATIGSGGASVILFAANSPGVAIGAQVSNTNFPASTYLRQYIVGSQEYLVLSHLPTNAPPYATGQTFAFAGASFICTQHLAGVTLQQSSSTLTVNPNGSSGTTLVCGPINGTGDLAINYNTGNVILTGNNSFNGSLTLNGGNGAGGVVATGNNTFSGSLTVNGGGKVQLTGVNTYSGPTMIDWGALTLGANSWPSNTPSIYIYNYQNLIGTAIPGGIVVGPNQLIYGGIAPYVQGNVTINGTVSPGATPTDVEPFGFSTNLTLAGTTVMKLDKDLTPGATNDLLQGIQTLQYGGTLIVTNIGATPLVLGDSFKLFGAVHYTNDFAVKNLPPLDASLGWTWSPATGTLSVGNATASAPTNLMFSVSGSTLTLTWPASYLGWYAQSNSVSVANSNQWYDITGSQSLTTLGITINPTTPQVYYRMRHP